MKNEHGGKLAVEKAKVNQLQIQISSLENILQQKVYRYIICTRYQYTINLEISVVKIV